MMSLEADGLQDASGVHALDAIDEGWEEVASSSSRLIPAERSSSSSVSNLPIAASDPPVQATREVTLIVYGWKMVEPGTLWWVFPSVTAALSAARAMTNAVRWAIVEGPPKGAIVDIGRARAAGSVLFEQSA